MYNEETAECFIVNLTETDIADNESENNSIRDPEEIEWYISSPESVEDNE